MSSLKVYYNLSHFLLSRHIGFAGWKVTDTFPDAEATRPDGGLTAEQEGGEKAGVTRRPGGITGKGQEGGGQWGHWGSGLYWEESAFTCCIKCGSQNPKQRTNKNQHFR